jgi:hypothetical protein
MPTVADTKRAGWVTGQGQSRNSPLAQVSSETSGPVCVLVA